MKKCEQGVKNDTIHEPHFSCFLDFCVHCWVVFRHMVFADGFLFLVKELGLLTNLGHWVRVLDVVVSFLHLILVILVMC